MHAYLVKASGFTDKARDLVLALRQAFHQVRSLGPPRGPAARAASTPAGGPAFQPTRARPPTPNPPDGRTLQV